VVLAPARLVTVTGRVTGNPVTLAGIARGTLRFALAPAAGTSPAFLGPTPPAQPVRDDMTFELSTYPGTFVVRPIALTGLVIRSVRANGLDAMKGFAIDATAAVTDLEVEVTDETGKVVVAVTNARGEPAPDQSIVVFPQEQDAWGALLPGRIGTGSTNEQGVYQSPALLAGSYSVAVTEPLEPGQSSDPAFLESIRDGAQAVVVSAGGTQSVSLRISAR
jgi:hypothetical protein